VAVDLIGHGDSDTPADPARYTMPNAVADLVSLVDQVGGSERFGVLGYSMGARVALHLAAACPQRIAALVLESGSPGLRDPEERRTRRAADEALAARIEHDGVAAFVDEWERLPLFASQATLSPKVLLELRQQRLRNTATGLANSLRGMGTGAQEPLWERLHEIAAPTLIIAGALDLKFRHIAQEMARGMPQAHVEIVREAGHAVHLERPDVFDGLALGFVSEYLRDRPRAAAVPTV
jgi:2-succinyl-6-hydroxy-2,4-cyclohexadiene-1-carboxylate synthase